MGGNNLIIINFINIYLKKLYKMGNKLKSQKFSKQPERICGNSLNGYMLANWYPQVLYAILTSMSIYDNMCIYEQ